jgi:hypothetical protein
MGGTMHKTITRIPRFAKEMRRRTHVITMTCTYYVILVPAHSERNLNGHQTRPKPRPSQEGTAAVRGWPARLLADHMYNPSSISVFLPGLFLFLSSLIVLCCHSARISSFFDLIRDTCVWETPNSLAISICVFFSSINCLYNIHLLLDC